MTKQAAAEKVAKLRRLAASSSSPSEADTARRQADRIVAENNLTEGDLAAGRMAAAFDDLVGEIERVVARSPIPSGIFGAGPAIQTVLQKIRSLDDADKAKKLQQIAGIVRVASFIAGGNQQIADVKAALDASLKNHDLLGIVL